MKLIALATLATISIGTATATVHAADITYEGSLSGEGLTANYTITTDGVLGYLNGSDILSYSALIENAAGSVAFDQTTPGATFMTNNVDYTKSNVVVGSFLSTIEINGPDNNRIVDESFLSNPEESVEISTPGNNQAFEVPDATTFATAVAAAPEPSTWLLMFAGIGGIGLMLRRAKKTMGFRFKGALSA